MYKKDRKYCELYFVNLYTLYMENFNGPTLTYKPHSGNKENIYLQPVH